LKRAREETLEDAEQVIPSVGLEGPKNFEEPCEVKVSSTVLK